MTTRDGAVQLPSHEWAWLRFPIGQCFACQELHTNAHNFRHLAPGINMLSSS